MVGDPPGERVRLLVLYGGRSAEHEVSCISALHVVRAIDPTRYDVRLVGITTDGQWVDATPALRGGPGAHTLALPSPDTLRPTASTGRDLEPVEAVTSAGVASTH